MHGKHTGDRNTLLLPSGKLIGGKLAEFVHSHRLQAFFHTFPDLLRGNSHVLRAKAHILFYHLTDDLIIRVLENHSGFLSDIPKLIFLFGVHTIYPDSTLGRIKNRIHMLGQCGFSGTVMSQDRNKITLSDIQADFIHRTGNAFHISFFIPSDIFKYKILCLNDSHADVTLLSHLVYNPPCFLFY